MNRDFLEKSLELINEGIPHVVCTIVSIRGSAPQNVGAKAIIKKTGVVYGTVGGGALENRCCEWVVDTLNNDIRSVSSYHQWNLQTDIGMTCGGDVGLFFEVVLTRPPWEIVVFGAGHVGQALCEVLLNLQCSITCIDDREEWLEKLPRHRHLQKICVSGAMENEVANLNLNSFLVMVTKGHKTDVPIAFAALSRGEFPFLGMMGSKVKSLRVKSDLLGMGLTETAVETLNCPMGEPFGNNTPPEIALSMTAQLIRERDIIFQH
ncbi:XdhC family protein [Bacteriovoracaceae bacterium]|nr:XdhC family protein [Bacteriovoracaceae bacterium]